MGDATAADLTDLLTPRHEGVDLVRDMLGSGRHPGASAV